MATARLWVLACLALIAPPIEAAGIYLHSPRGSNNRNCRNDNNENRRNGNRLFDSQNNNKGGYSCPRSYPFDCYKYADGTPKNECNAKNTANPTAEMVNNNQSSPFFGELENSMAVKGNKRMFYFVGSTLAIQWTAMRAHSEQAAVVIQIACEDSLTDSLGTVRDGTPVNNNDGK